MDEVTATSHQRWANAVTPALQRAPTIDLSISPEMRGPCTMIGEAPVPALFLLMGYFNSSDSLIRAGDDEDFPMRVTAAANPHLETHSSRQVRGDSGRSM